MKVGVFEKNLPIRLQCLCKEKAIQTITKKYEEIINKEIQQVINKKVPITKRSKKGDK